MKKQRLISVGVVLLCAAVGAILYAAWDIYSYSRISEPIRADAAVVLGAAAWGDRPSPVFGERIDHAVDLYKQGYVDKIVFTGGQGDRDEPAESVVARQYAAGLGVPQEDILVEMQSRTTGENLYYAYQLASKEGLTTFLIVSDPLHMRRAVRIARDMGMDAHSSPTPTTRYQSTGSQLRFLARETFFYLKYLILRLG